MDDVVKVRAAQSEGFVIKKGGAIEDSDPLEWMSKDSKALDYAKQWEWTH